ncbi:hypothetical protein Ct61P_11304 [Colletotrichum tofieldiae]|nr:hypothetical protein Ct61P_11304 [Colletotrichum tofieldiae]
MVQMYTIAGRQIGSHYLAMGVLATLFGGAFYGTSGSKPKATAAPPSTLPAPTRPTLSNNRKFLDSADKDEKAKH